MPSSFPFHYFCSLHRSIAKAANDGNDDLWTSSLETAEGKLLKKLTTQIEQRLDYMAGVSFIDFLSKGYK